ncbi:uncharacterized protein LOC100907748 [Galendromus occidentalis]|uniref:Uncharacterized protein LOC100907748 n=1 Tax=Galendromus occidentalis TaxID=34638 RepID=A0AAJ7L5M5_9ACAR|nr:uncharacterized protein LOC100907748 [Galendromus occidentalis]
MADFRVVKGAKSWVWRWYRKASDRAQCSQCLKELKNVRNTSSLIDHLSRKHEISKDSPGWSSSVSGQNVSESTLEIAEEEAPPESELDAHQVVPVAKRRKTQLRIDSFVVARRTIRSEIVSLICESNLSMNQVITSGAVNRSLTRAYPNDPPPPKSHSSLRVLLSEEATRVRNDLMTTLQQIREKGMKFSMSFDEATLIGTDRYLTVNLHHSDKIFGCSNIAPLGLIRVKERATGEYLRDVICHRLSSFKLSRNDIVAAVTDGASNVLKAVDLIGVHRQKCFAHGLDLVIRKAVYGAQAAAFDVAILTDGDDRSISRVDSGDDSPEDSDRSDAEDTGIPDDDDERVRDVELSDAR